MCGISSIREKELDQCLTQSIFLTKDEVKLNFFKNIAIALVYPRISLCFKWLFELLISYFLAMLQ